MSRRVKKLVLLALVIGAILIALSIFTLLFIRQKSQQANVQVGVNAPSNYVPRAPQQAVEATVAWARGEQAAQLQSWLQRHQPPPVCSAVATDQSTLPDSVRYHTVEDERVRRQLVAGLEPVLRLVGCPDVQGLVLYKGQTVSASNLPNNQIAITPDASYFSRHGAPNERIFRTLGILRVFLAREVFKQMIPVEQPGEGLTLGDMRLRHELKVNYMAAIASLTIDNDSEILNRAALDISLNGNSKTVEDYTTGRTRSEPTLQQIQDVFGAARQDFR